MPKKPKRPRDSNQLAAFIIGAATGEIDNDVVETNTKKRKAGLKGAKERAKTLTPEQRSEIAQIAAQARWKKGD